MNNLRATHLPYCIQKRPNGAYVILNRRYKPIGFGSYVQDRVEYDDYPIDVEIKGLTPKIAAQISFEGNQDTNNIFLYGDGCIPTSSNENMQSYLSRLAVLMQLETGIIPLPKKTSLFYQWLIQQDERDDSVGDLAGDTRGDRRFPVNGDYNAIHEYLSSYSKDVVRSFKAAWQEFEQEQRKAAS